MKEDKKINIEPEPLQIEKCDNIENEKNENEEFDTKIEEENNSIDIEKVMESFQKKALNYLIEQTNHVVIPSFSKWFDMNEINSIEKKLFPDFFGENSVNSAYRTKENYKNMRDFMINLFRLNPREYLTVTAVRRNLSGDVGTIIRIHQFLERWGLINYQIDPRTKPSIVGPQYTGHFVVTLDTPHGLIPFIYENLKIKNNDSNSSKSNEKINNDMNEPKKHHLSSDSNSIPINLEIRRNVYDVSDVSDFNQNSIVQYFCNVCGNDTSKTRYHNLKIKSYNQNTTSTSNNAMVLCSICYEQGLFPLNFQSSDYVKFQMNSNSENWTQQEVLLLLEGIEMYGDSDIPINGTNNYNGMTQWDKISDHVTTKSKEQCIIKFINLPIEDKYLESFYQKKKKDSDFDLNQNKEQIIQEIFFELIKESKKNDTLKKNSETKLNETLLQEKSLINQIIKLTLKKFEHKLNTFEKLQLYTTKLLDELNLEKKQVKIERWLLFEKVIKLKEKRPDLKEILNDLIQPIKVDRINKIYNTNEHINEEENLNLFTEEKFKKKDENLPNSLSKIENFLFWSG